MYLALSFPRENFSGTALSGNMTLNRFFSGSQDLKVWWDLTTFKHHSISAFKVFSSIIKEESCFCSVDRTSEEFEVDCGERGPSFADVEDWEDTNNPIALVFLAFSSSWCFCPFLWESRAKEPPDFKSIALWHNLQRALLGLDPSLETHNEYFGLPNQLSWNVDLEWGFDII